MKRLLFIIALLALSPTIASAVVFLANFENVSQGTTGDSALTAQVGTFTNLNSATSPYEIVGYQNTPRADFPDPGQNALFVDVLGLEGDYAVRADFTQTLSLSYGISIDFIYCHRRCNGGTKSHFVTGYDSSNNPVFEFVLADYNEFGVAGNDRQRPGYGTEYGRFRFSSEQLTPETYYAPYTWGNDGNPADGANINKFGSFSITLNNIGWDVIWIGKEGSGKDGGTLQEILPFYTGSPTDLAYITLSGESFSGGYWDDITVAQIPEPATLLILTLGSLSLLQTRKIT